MLTIGKKVYTNIPTTTDVNKMTEIRADASKLAKKHVSTYRQPLILM